MYIFTCFQVMEKAELLRDTDANLLPALLRLQELVRKCSKLFCVIYQVNHFVVVVALCG